MIRAKALEFDNLAELLDRLGDLPPERIRMHPPPGTATEEDVVAAALAPRKRLCELTDRVLVEKAKGTRESLLGGEIFRRLANLVVEHDLGIVLPSNGMLRLMPGLVRMPDVSFTPGSSVPGERVSGEQAIGSYVPELAVEVLSRTNTCKETDRKLRDHFASGTKVVWIVQPHTRSARVYTSPTRFRRISHKGVLQGSHTLSGFRLPLADLFERATRRPKKP